jgi:hypothetical protein
MISRTDQARESPNAADVEVIDKYIRWIGLLSSLRYGNLERGCNVSPAVAALCGQVIGWSRCLIPRDAAFL